MPYRQIAKQEIMQQRTGSNGQMTLAEELQGMASYGLFDVLQG